MRLQAGLIGCMVMVCALYAATDEVKEADPLAVPMRDVFRTPALKPELILEDRYEHTEDARLSPEQVLQHVTHMSPGVENPVVENGTLSFVASEDSVTLGWGNYKNKQTPDATVDLWHLANVVELDVEQTAGESTWTLWLWGDGARPAKPGRFYRNVRKETVSGTDRQTVRFPLALPGADGVEIKIDTKKGNRIKIHGLRFLKPETSGCFRKTFEIPSDASVWRAVGAVAAGLEFFVNGEQVDLHAKPHHAESLRLISVDLTDHLVPGANCVAFSGRFPRTDNVLFYFQGRVVLDTGDVIDLDPPDKWTYRPTADKGWTRADYKAAGWQVPETLESGDPLYPDSAFRYMFKRSTYFPLVEYDGRLVYANPQRQRLFFRSESPVMLHVRVPAGLETKQPAVQWRLRRVRHLDEEQIAEGTASTFSRQDQSLSFDLELGQLDQAVYTIETTLIADGQAIESRYREPFVVFGALDQKPVAGRTFEDGLDATLESTIDFTDPNDPHPWVDQPGEGTGKPRRVTKDPMTTPRIVDRDGLVYRETQHDNMGSFFSYKFSFEHPGDWYMLQVDYPNDKRRAIGVSITYPHSRRTGKPAKSGYMTDSGPAVETGLLNPVSGEMQTLKWIHRAEAGTHTVEIFNMHNGQRAAASALRVYHVEGNLPAMATEAIGERFFGIHSERPYYLGINFGLDMPSQYEFYYRAKGVDVLGYWIYRMAWYFDVAQHFTQYMRFCGQNIYGMGSYQYSQNNLSYSLPNRVSSSSQVPCDIRNMLLPMFEANGIRAMSVVEFVRDKPLHKRTMVSNQQVAEGLDTIMPVLKTGRQHGWLQNFIHPKVEQAYLKIVDDLAVKFGDWQAWRGVYLMPFPHQVGFGPAFCPIPGDPLSTGYSDATIRAFEHETGIDVPGEGPERFMARFQFLTAEDMLETWIDWRCKRQRDIALKTLEALRTRRDDLEVVLANYIATRRIKQWLTDEDLSYREVNRLWGFDASMYKSHEGLWYGRYMYPGPARTRSLADAAAVRQHRISPEAVEDYDRPMHRLVAMMTGWHERTERLHKDVEWPFTANSARFLPQTDGDNRKEPFTQAMIMNDPEIMFYGFSDVGQMVGQEQQTREVARALTSLPSEKLPLVLDTDANSNLAIRAGEADGAYFFYVANPGFWPVKGQVTLENAKHVMDAAYGKKVPVQREGDRTVVTVELGPYAVKTFSAPSGARVIEWSNEPLPQVAQEPVQGLVTDVLGSLSSAQTLKAITDRELAHTAGVLNTAGRDLASGRAAGAWNALCDPTALDIIEVRAKRAAFAASLEGNVDEGGSGPPSMTIVPSPGTPVIDGKLDEGLWQAAPPARLQMMVDVTLIPAGPALTETRMRALYGEKALYIGIACADPDVTALKAEGRVGREMFKKHDDCVDFFIKPDERQETIYHFAVNPAGAMFGEAQGGGVRQSIPEANWQAAVSIQDDRWNIECAIPYEVFDIDRPQQGTVWRGNYRRRHREFYVVQEQLWSLVAGHYFNWPTYGFLHFNGGT